MQFATCLVGTQLIFPAIHQAISPHCISVELQAHLTRNYMWSLSKKLWLVVIIRDCLLHRGNHHCNSKYQFCIAILCQFGLRKGAAAAFVFNAPKATNCVQALTYLPADERDDQSPRAFRTCTRKCCSFMHPQTNLRGNIYSECFDRDITFRATQSR